MKGFRPIALLAVSAAFVALPAAASAAPKVKEVRAVVKDANAALGDATAAARVGKVGPLRSSLARIGGYTKRADQMARKIRRLADSRGDRVRAARSLIAVAGQYDRLVGRFAELLDEVSPQVQALIAQGLTLSADAQARIVTMLTKLTTRLPAPVAQSLLDAIERFETDGDFEALIEALASDEVTDSVKAVLSAQLDEMFVHLEAMIDRLAEIDPALADSVRGIVGSLQGLLEGVNDLFTGLFDSLLGGGIPVFPGLGELPGFGDFVPFSRH